VCTAFKMHVNSAFQVSSGMKVTCSSGLDDRHTRVIFKLCVLQHPGYAYILGFQLPLCHSSESKVIEMASRFLENCGPPAIECTCNLSTQKDP
jgi:hypothetical protein